MNTRQPNPRISLSILTLYSHSLFSLSITTISANTEPRSIVSVNTDKQVLKHLTVGTKVSNQPRIRAVRHINATHTSSERHQAFQRLLRKEAGKKKGTKISDCR
jgi:hypothetical protein